MSFEISGFTVTLSNEAKGDVNTLGQTSTDEDFERQIAIEVVRIANEIEQHPWHGTPLRDDGEIPHIGNLRKVPFDPDGHKPPRFRLVYRLVPDDGPNPSGAQVVAIGPRENLKVYEIASRRNK